MSQDNFVAVFGETAIAQKIAEHLNISQQSEDGLSQLEGALLVCVSRADLGDIAMKLNQLSQPYVVIYWSFDEIGVGPLVMPASPSCPRCLVTREDNNTPSLAVIKAERENAPLSPSVMSYLEMELAITFSQQLLTLGQFNEIITISKITQAVSRHRFLPDPLCEVCGTAVDDCSDLIIPPQSQQPTPKGWRVRDYREELDTLKARYVDPKLGIVKTVGTDITTSLSAPGPARHLIGVYDHEDWTAGLTHRFPHSQAVGIIEAIERYGGLRSRTRKAVVRGSYQQFSEQAIDPASFVLFDAKQYSHPEFPCVPLTAELEMSWIWAWSAKKDGPILVPEQLAYYDVGRFPANELFVIENSNGCAAGGTYEEALIHGVFEAIERDGALRSWYQRRPLSRIELNSCTDETLIESLYRVAETTDYEIVAYDATQETGIPTVWMVAYNRKDEGPATFSSSKAHPDAQIAISGALAELCGAIHYHESQYEKRRNELLPMLNNSALVLEEFDHTLLAGLPEAKYRFDFLDSEPKPVKTVQELTVPEAEQWSLDSGIALKGIAEKLAAQGWDLIAVDQTPPEAKQIGLSVVRALIPGIVPFTLGHNYRRVATARIELPEDNELWPHPFA